MTTLPAALVAEDHTFPTGDSSSTGNIRESPVSSSLTRPHNYLITMDPFRRAQGVEDGHGIWRSNPTPIPDDMIDPALLGPAVNNQNESNHRQDNEMIDRELVAAARNSSQNHVAADQTSPHQHPQHPLQQLFEDINQIRRHNNVEQTSVYQPLPLEFHYNNPFIDLQVNPRFNHQPTPQLFSSPGDPSFRPHPQLDVRQFHPPLSHYANSQVDPRFHTQAYFRPSAEPRAQGYSPHGVGSDVHQDQPFNHFVPAYSPVSRPPHDGRVFFHGPAAERASLPVDPTLTSQGDAPASSVPGTPHIQQDNAARASVELAQSPTRNSTQSFSRGFGRGPMELDDNSPFSFEDEVDSSPLSSLAATPAVASATVAQPSGQENTTMTMDLSNWDSGRKAEVGLPSSSPPRNNVIENENIDATPKHTCAEQREELQERERQRQRPLKYRHNMDVLLASVWTEPTAPVADMEIAQTMFEGPRASRAATLVNTDFTSHDPSLQRPGVQENFTPRCFSGIGDARCEEVMQRIPTLGPGISFPPGVPYSNRNSSYAEPPEEVSQPLGLAQAMPPLEKLVAEGVQPLSADWGTQMSNVSGPQVGESSRHGQYLESQAPWPSTFSATPQVQQVYHPSLPSHESYTEAVMQHMRPATAGPSGSVSNAPTIPQPATSGHKLSDLVQRPLEETSVYEAVAAADAILSRDRDLTESQHLRKLTPKPPTEAKNPQIQRQDQQGQAPSEEHESTEKDSTKAEPESAQVPTTFSNMDQFQPTRAPTTTLQHPLLISPYPPRIPNTFTPAILSLITNPPRCLQLGTSDSLQSYLSARNIVPFNDLYPRTFPIPPEREAFNRTVIVEARYISVIGLLYPRAEFIVSRIAEGAEGNMQGERNRNKKLEPNAAMMMDRWHMYKAVRMTGEEMQKMGVCVWSEKGCEEWKADPALVEAERRKSRGMEPMEQSREVKRPRRKRTFKTKVMVVDDDGDDGDKKEEEEDRVDVASGKALKENSKPTVEVDQDCQDVDIIGTEKEGQGFTEDPSFTSGKGKGKEVLHGRDGNEQAVAPSPFKGTESASAYAARGSTSHSRQADFVAEEGAAASQRVEDNWKEPAPPNPDIIATRKLKTQQMDESGESNIPAVAAAVSPSSSRPIKTPKRRLLLSTNTATTTTTKSLPLPTHAFDFKYPDPRAPYIHDPYDHESRTPYLITLLQRDYPSGGVARIQCTVSARKVIENIQSTFGVLQPYEVWRMKDYKVFDKDKDKNSDTNSDTYEDISTGEDDRELRKVFFDEMGRKMREREREGQEERRGEKGEGMQESRDGNGDGDGKEEIKDMSILKEREKWKENYKALKCKGKRVVARAKAKRKEEEDADMDFDDWWDERREEVNELVEKWFSRREGLVEEFEVDRQVIEFALFEYGGGDGLGLSKPYN
ncbi:unnamed protein product [Sordaria macrospora k-hell]|uniref:WGS project CABT00000000 data, contig 2.27 n=1 Tax=Sordaria macrospora (strain ATCC MYA-333 / DSM 997 / K(L3346) / K-hell) TaxID=771870 RepID=F7W479_SORMK|nr:uncharacterized protein SMAC_09401 [Sordaria macrospora k-hell]CCC14832.1 unnamed protein product [Sordaria macrospora k-hell]